uniref:Rho GTPase-activating protein 7 isoform X2 n=1 Tax=Rhizophora mucronata TaxID=61149 RepID=A0A2P2MTF3_RHIMU
MESRFQMCYLVNLIDLWEKFYQQWILYILYPYLDCNLLLRRRVIKQQPPIPMGSGQRFGEEVMRGRHHQWNQLIRLEKKSLPFKGLRLQRMT